MNTSWLNPEGFRINFNHLIFTIWPLQKSLLQFFSQRNQLVTKYSPICKILVVSKTSILHWEKYTKRKAFSSNDKFLIKKELNEIYEQYYDSGYRQSKESWNAIVFGNQDKRMKLIRKNEQRTKFKRGHFINHIKLCSYSKRNKKIESI